MASTTSTSSSMDSETEAEYLNGIADVYQSKESPPSRYQIDKDMKTIGAIKPEEALEKPFENAYEYMDEHIRRVGRPEQVALWETLTERWMKLLRKLNIARARAKRDLHQPRQSFHRDGPMEGAAVIGTQKRSDPAAKATEANNPMEGAAEIGTPIGSGCEGFGRQ